MDRLHTALASIHSGLRTPLLREFSEGLEAYYERDWEKVGLKAGKLCEITYSIIDGHIRQNFPSKPSKPKNMFDACKAFEQADPKKYSRAIRIQVPRVLLALYEMRNNRNIGHVGADVDPSYMDAEYYLRAMKWIVAELVRNFSSQDVNAASSLVEELSAPQVLPVWSAHGTKRVLNPLLNAAEKVICVLAGERAPIPTTTLAEWVQYGNLSRFRSGVLKRLDRKKFIHFDLKADCSVILPAGSARALELSQS